MSVAPFKLNTNPINEETRLIAEKELNETPERVASAVAELRNLLQAATDLHYHDDEDFLITFLRPCHFYPESALNLVSKTNNLHLLFISFNGNEEWVVATCLSIAGNKLWLHSGAVSTVTTTHPPNRRDNNKCHIFSIHFIRNHVVFKYQFYIFAFLCCGFPCYLTRNTSWSIKIEIKSKCVWVP